MKPLVIESTKSSPAVIFDPTTNRLSISGQSYPENAFKFYEPLFAWIDAFLQQLKAGDTVRFELELPYINTSSTKCLMMILDKLEDAHLAGTPVEIYWYHNPDNESELECAEEFKEDLTLPFHFIAKEAE